MAAKGASDLVAAICAAKDEEAMRARTQDLFNVSGEAGLGFANEALSEMAHRLEDLPSNVAGWVALVCGALVENGADPRIALPAVLRRIEAYAQIPAEVWPRLDQAACAMLSRLGKERGIYVGSPALRAAAKAMEEELGGEPFFRSLLDVIDDLQLIVLHGGTRRGFQVVADGVVDNFQLQVLLADALIGGNLVPGVQPDRAVVEVFSGRGPQQIEQPAHGVWNLVNWDGTWIWGEGRPADILPLDGVRLIRLEPLPYARTWNTARLFAWLLASVRVEASLTPEEVQRWVLRLRPVRSTREAV